MSDHEARLARLGIQGMVAHRLAALAEAGDLDRTLPKLARDPTFTRWVKSVIQSIAVRRELVQADSRDLREMRQGSVHLVLTSPPYWTLKRYNEHPAQLGPIEQYDVFLDELDRVWRHCYRLLVPGGRLVCVVGDVCLSRRNNGRHAVVPLHASIQERCRRIGFDNLTPIIWNKIANVRYESGRRPGGFLGKPYEPNAIVKNDVEFILIFRKPGGYRKPSPVDRILSLISAENHRRWFRQVWSDIPGASTRIHPAPYPLELAERLVRMFSFVSDTVLDPFAGSGTTILAASRWGRSSIGVEVDAEYYRAARRRLAA